MPVVVGDESTARQIWYYTLVLVPLTLLMTYPLQATGAIYAVFALVLGWIFIQKAWALLKMPSGPGVWPKGYLSYSILYMMLLSAGIGNRSLASNQLGNNLRFLATLSPCSAPCLCGSTDP